MSRSGGGERGGGKEAGRQGALEEQKNMAVATAVCALSGESANRRGLSGESSRFEQLLQQEARARERAQLQVAALSH